MTGIEGMEVVSALQISSLTLMTNMPTRTKSTGTMYWNIQDRVSLMKYSLRLFIMASKCLQK